MSANVEGRVKQPSGPAETSGENRPVVAIVTDAIAPYHRGGKELRYEKLVPRLAEHLEVHVYTMNWWAGPRTISRDGAQYHAICRYWPLYRGGRRSIRQAVVFALSCRKLLRARFDVLEADHVPYLQLFVLKLIALVRRRRLVVSWNEVWNREQWRTYLGPAGLPAFRLEQLATHLPDGIIAISPETAYRLRTRVPGKPVTVAPPGIDLGEALQATPAADRVDIVSVGRLLPHKRFDLLLDSLAVLARRGHPLRCRIIGDGPLRDQLKRQCRRLGLAQTVEFRAGVPSDELLGDVKAAQLFVFPSEREGFGIAVLEAIACGVPVITTSAPNNFAQYLVSRSSQGVICEPSPMGLADAIEATLDDGATDVRLAAETERTDDWVREYDWGSVAITIARALVPGLAIAEPSLKDEVQAPAQPGDDEAVAAAPAPRPEQANARRIALPDLALSLAGVIAIAGLSRVRGVWILQATELILLLSLPGFVLMWAVGAGAATVRAFPIYLPAASLCLIMIAGLAVDLIGPPLGVPRPIATVPLTVGICATLLLLIVIALLRRVPSLISGGRHRLRLQHAWPLLLPALAWIGAMRLNNGHGNAMAIVAVACSGIVVIAAAFRADRIPLGRLALIVYAVGLALMWGFSLRGSFVYGFDIAGEYQTFAHVLAEARWHPSHANDAYGAMLSLTILPSTFSVLTGAAPLLILKAVYPLLFAFFPVAVLLLLARLLDRRFAFLGVLFVVVQDYLFQQLPAIARQEIGLLLFAALTYAMLDRRLRTGARAALLTLLALGVVLSHYGTAYYTIALFGLALALELARTLFVALRHRRPFSIPRSTIVPLIAAFAITGAGAFIWYGPVTDSAQNFGQFIDDVHDRGLDILPTAGHHGIVGAYVSGNVTTQVSGNKFTQLAQQDFRDNHRFRYIRPLAQAYLPGYQLASVRSPNAPVRSHVAIVTLDVERELVTQLAIAIAAIGAFALWLRRDTTPDLRLIGAMGLGAVAILAAVRFSGTIANDYNQTRAFLQAMVPLSACLAWALEWIAKRSGIQSRRRAAIPAGFAVALALLLLTTSGLRGPIIGGSTPANLSGTGDDSERFLVTAPEVAAARWLVRSAPSPDVVFADRYGALRLNGLTGRPRVFDLLTPPTLDRNAWVYADRSNFADGRARGQVNSNYALYAWPRFVDDFWNLVYTNGTSAVYTRTPTP